MKESGKYEKIRSIRRNQTNIKDSDKYNEISQHMRGEGEE